MGLLVNQSKIALNKETLLLLHPAMGDFEHQGLLKRLYTVVAPVEPFATGIKIFDWRNFTLIA